MPNKQRFMTFILKPRNANGKTTKIIKLILGYVPSCHNQTS